MNTKRLFTAVVPVVPVVAAAGIGGLGARNAPQTYARLRTPSWAPPASAFGPVWSALYVATAVAGYRIAGDRAATRVHLVQLGLNAAWPNVFFGRRDKRVSLAVIAALDATLAVEIIRVARGDRAAAALLAPYLAWTSFATALNASVSDPAAS